MSLRVAIVEDSQENVETLRFLLEQLGEPIEIVAIANTLEEAEKVLINSGIDLAFLDIQLKEGNIFDVLDRLGKKDINLPDIIFATAHGSFEYATKAIKFACLDFITKPLDINDIRTVIHKFKKKQAQTSDISQQVEFMLQLLKGNMQAPQSIGIVLSKGVIEFTELRDIIYISADENISQVVLTNKQKLTSIKSLGYYSDLLQGNNEFIQISKSCLLNLDYLKTYNHRDKSIILKSGESIVASHRYSRFLRKALLESGKSSSSFPGIQSLKRFFGG